MNEHKLEAKIQRQIVDYLQGRGWHVERMLASAFQCGIPDLYAFHKQWGERWIEVKRPDEYTFTRAQRRKWPQWEKAGVPIWILTAANQEQYDLLFQAPNWREFWKLSFEIPDVDAMVDELAREYEQEQQQERASMSEE